MSNLIINFPSRSVPQEKKRVRFSPTSRLTFVERVDETTDTSSIFYSAKEYRAMRMETKKAAIHAQKALSSGSEQVHVHEMDNVNLTGIEHCSRYVKGTKAYIVKHIDAVLSVQKRQASAGAYDTDRLSCVLRRHSKSAARRAHAIGMIRSR